MTASGPVLSDLGPALFLSAHFDDAVLSCGRLIAALPGSYVLTVFSGGPAQVEALPLWDRQCGFAPGDPVMEIRAEEDDAALTLLDATGVRLGFWDDQYRTPVGTGLPLPLARVARRLLRGRGDSELVGQIADRLAAAVADLKVETCFAPLGISHVDHKLTTRAALTLTQRVPGTRLVFYDDLPYASESATNRADAVDTLQAAGITLAPFELAQAADGTRKRAAIDRYPTQLRGLGTRAEIAAAAAERYSLPLAPSI